MNEKAHDDEDKKPHEYGITVNARPKTVASKELTFDQVLALAFAPVPMGDNWEFTIAFRRGQGNKPEGTLSGPIRNCPANGMCDQAGRGAGREVS